MPPSDQAAATEPASRAQPRPQEAPSAPLMAVLTRTDLQLITGITIGAAVLRFAALNAQSLWYDESVTASLVAEPFGTMFRLLRTSETAPPFYYVVAWIWVRLFGSSDAALRSLSALAGTLTVPVVYAAGRILISRSAALIAATLAACSPLLVWYSQEARAYSLLLLLGALSVLAFGLLREAPTPKRAAWWAIASSLAVATYYYAAFLVLAEAVLLLRRHRRHLALALGTGAIVATSGLLLPLAVLQARTGNAAWIHSIKLSSRVEEAIRQLITPAAAPLYAGTGTAEHQGRQLWILGLVVLGLALGLVLHLGGKRERQGALLAFGLAAAMFVVPMVATGIAPLVLGVRSDTFLYRAILPAWIPLALVLGAGFGVVRARLLGSVAAAMLIAASLGVTIAIAVDGSLQRDDLRSAGSAIQGMGLVVVFPAFERHPLLRYRSDLERAPSTGQRVQEIEVLVQTSHTPTPEFTPPRSFALVETRRVQHFLLERFRSPSAVSLEARELMKLADEGFGLISPRRPAPRPPAPA